MIIRKWVLFTGGQEDRRTGGQEDRKMSKNTIKPSKEYRWREFKSDFKFNFKRFFRMRWLDLKIYFKYHRVPRILTIVFVLLLIANIGKDILRKNAASELSGDLDVADYEEYAETLKDIPSDIEGMSQYDKYAMGLDYRDGSDTDQDGLTDKEEIEKYGTDPLKSSTSGDLYTDGYKVENGMDTSSSYPFDNDLSFGNNRCNEVLLSAKTATDFNATVEDCSNRYELDNWGIEEVYKGYFICNFSGDMTIDISELVLERAVNPSKISVWTYEGAFLAYGYTDLEECDFTEENNTITIEKEFNPDYSYYVFITPKKTLINSLLKTNETDAIQIGTTTSSVHYLITDFFNQITIYYPEMDNEADEETFMKSIDSKYDTSLISYKKSSEDKIQAMYKGYTSTVPFMENDFSVTYPVEKLTDFLPIIPKVLFSYQLCYYTDTTTINAGADGSASDDDVKYAYNNYHTDFDPYADVLPFQNFNSKYANGNCAGICYLTSALYNTGTFPGTGSYGDIEWDLTGDEANATLMDRGLEDYKSKDFVDKKGKNGMLGDGLTTGEREFVDMIGAYLKQTNDTFNLNAYKIDNKNGLSWDVAEVMMDRLDQGKIFTAAILMADGTGHEIICYDYYWLTDDEMLFRVYDSNIPMKHTDLSTLNCDGACYLQCKKISNGDGTYSFKYFYWPVKDNTMYCASSDAAQTPYSAIIISDETWQIYN